MKKACHPCTTLRQIPRQSIAQSINDAPDGIWIAYAAHIFKRNRPCFLVLGECVTSYTPAQMIASVKCHDLRDSLICLYSEPDPRSSCYDPSRSNPRFPFLSNRSFIQEILHPIRSWTHGITPTSTKWPSARFKNKKLSSLAKSRTLTS